MSIRTGTSNFVSVATAVRYYADYGLRRADVYGKIRDREINIGVPERKPGQRLEIIDNGTRYAIVEG